MKTSNGAKRIGGIIYGDLPIHRVPGLDTSAADFLGFAARLGEAKGKVARMIRREVKLLFKRAEYTTKTRNVGTVHSAQAN